MKKLFYSLFALFFNISRILPVKKGRVVLLAPHKGGAHDSLSITGKFLKEKGYEVLTVSTAQMSTVSGALSFFINGSRKLATAEYVFLNDNFMPMASLNFSEKTVITQLWHAEGAFKKFGLLAPLTDEIAERERKCSEKLTFITCTSKNLVSVYAEAFGVDESKILPAGSPRLDYLLGKHDTEKIRADFDKSHPGCKGKKLILYAPTFRDDPAADSEILSHLNPELFEKELGDEYILLVKLHPQIHAEAAAGFIDVTKEDIGPLTIICDKVITDYSSVCMDFALLEKPCIFFAYDLEEYEKERSFCFGYEDYIPGKAVRTFEEVIEEIKNPRSSGNAENFREFNFDYTDTHNTERLWNQIQNIISSSR